MPSYVSSSASLTSNPESLILESPPAAVELPADPLSPADSLPLSNKTILVTRAASQSSQFTKLLQEQGAMVIEMPTLEIGPPSNWRDLDRAIAHLDDFDWLILTSTNGVDYFFDRLNAQTGDPIPATNIKIAVVGEKTAQRLARLGLQPDFIPPDFVADSLVTNFPEPLSGLRMLFPRVESGGREVLVKEFVNQGAKVREVAAYESRCPDAIAPNALSALRNHTVDVITFASSKTVQHFCQLLQQADESWQAWIDGVCIASIGPQTSQSCQDLLGRVDLEAQEYTLDGLTGAIVQWATPDPDDGVAEAEAETVIDTETETVVDTEVVIAEAAPTVEEKEDAQTTVTEEEIELEEDNQANGSDT
ncbi:MAG: uroporphyrinogen-III synthase [Leptolyngbyaceae cyanobacterium RU_5_1]|nr:uroporphyrinogen-III synthase [Leptolyngbyaceae cyanobacterium RU_5_1]